jgi:hypothetical protein
MAKKLDSFPEQRLGRPPGSQFDEYFDGAVWELTMKDFPHLKDLRSLRASMTAIANTRERITRFRTSIQGDKLYVQAILLVQEGSETNGKAT